MRPLTEPDSATFLNNRKAQDDFAGTGFNAKQVTRIPVSCRRILGPMPRCDFGLPNVMAAQKSI